nr:hypothetical protein CFP56_30145 [Quercus suber]
MGSGGRERSAACPPVFQAITESTLSLQFPTCMRASTRDGRVTREQRGRVQRQVSQIWPRAIGRDDGRPRRFRNSVAFRHKLGAQGVIELARLQ